MHGVGDGGGSCGSSSGDGIGEGEEFERESSSNRVGSERFPRLGVGGKVKIGG